MSSETDTGTDAGTEPVRVLLRDDGGVPVLSYLPGTRDGLPWADDAALLAPPSAAADEVMTKLAGWLVSVSPRLGHELTRRGATIARHAFTMSLDLRPGLAEPLPPSGIRFVPCDRPAADIQPAVSAAFPPGHIDHHTDRGIPEPPPSDDGTELEQLLTGTLIGPLLPCSLLAVDAADRVIGGCLVNELSPRPWLTLMFRDPSSSPAGLGALLLAAVAARAGADGVASMGLAVTAGNPAQHVYERAGFVVMDEALTVYVPVAGA